MADTTNIYSFSSIILLEMKLPLFFTANHKHAATDSVNNTFQKHKKKSRDWFPYSFVREYQFSFCLNGAAGLNFGLLDAAMVIVSLVLGFRPSRAALSTDSNVPKPIS